MPKPSLFARIQGRKGIRVPRRTVKPSPPDQPPPELEEVRAIPDRVVFDGRQFLNKGLPSRKIEIMDPRQRREWLQGVAVRANRASREQLYENFAQAYATYAQVPLDFGLAKSIEEAVGRKVDKRTPLLRLVMELFITYGDGDEDKGTVARRRATNLYARDVAAARALMHSGVLPSQVVALSREKGEGLNTWARRGLGSQDQAKPNEPEKSESTLSVVVRAQTRSTGGETQVERFQLGESKFARDLLDSLRKHKAMLKRAEGGSSTAAPCIADGGTAGTMPPTTESSVE